MPASQSGGLADPGLARQHGRARELLAAVEEADDRFELLFSTDELPGCNGHVTHILRRSQGWFNSSRTSSRRAQGHFAAAASASRATCVSLVPGAGLEPARPRWGTPNFVVAPFCVSAPAHLRKPRCSPASPPTATAPSRWASGVLVAPWLPRWSRSLGTPQPIRTPACLGAAGLSASIGSETHFAKLGSSMSLMLC